MDLGAVGLDGLVGSDSGFASLASDLHKWYGSGISKQQRSGATEDDWRSSKLAKTQDISASKTMLLPHRNSLLRSNATLFSDGQHQQQMLSFSTPKSEPILVEKNSSSVTLPYSYHPLSSYSRSAGYSCGSMHGVLTGARGPFSPSQWMELEHQALIYKYLTANVPVPSHLLIPIKKALDSAGFCNFSTGLPLPNALGWGGFHLGFSNNTDPEPGRCRRTDGKKWRCSRDAVVDQKYCERHMNRGRHRSRKPVEGQSGHAVAGTTPTSTTATSTASKLIPNASSSVSLVVPANNLHPLPSTTSAANNINRMFLTNKANASERMQDSPALPMLPPSLELKPKDSPFMLHKGQIQYEESSRRNEFGLVTSDSLLNPSQNPTDRETESQQSLRHFIDDWPRNQSDRSGVSWPELEMQSERTQLSISIPMAASDYMSSTSSPTSDKITLSPLRLSRELDPIQMGLGVGSGVNESNSRQANWVPITWESSMGGPLGEVLHLSNNNTSDCAKNSSSALNLMSDGWDNSPPLGSSPTGVLQNSTFVSLSNSNAGSSPRAENKAHEGACLCNDLLGTSSSLPAL